MFLYKRNKGIALIAVYLVIVILTILGAAFFMQSYSESKLALRHKNSTKAICIAEAGIERALYDLRQDFDTDESWSNGVTINSTAYGPSTSFYNIYSSKPLGGGSYTVKLKNISGEKGKIWVRSAGTIGGISRTIQTYVKMITIPMWDNAIFAGAGAAGTMISGNVDIRGSVHILGTGLDADNLAMDLGGNAQIGNHYKGLDEGLRNKIPVLDTTTYSGDEVETLHAKLRVKQGVVALSGTATVGDKNYSSGYKKTMDGVYVTNGFGGNSGVDNVYSDNDTGNPYDLGDNITFPRLTTAFVSGYKNNALVIKDADDLDTIASITPTSSFNFSDDKGSITMDGAGNLSISGNVYIDGGNLNMSKAGSEATITYTGTGTIFVDSKVVDDALVGGNVAINTNLITPAPEAGNTTFPYKTVGTTKLENIIGIMTPHNITFNEAQINVMGLFYAEDTITSKKQTDVVGTFISNYFDMGTNVPAIYQVPEVIDHIPPGMVRTEPVIEIVAWQEI
ncbi:MAG: hypothetical protein JSW18_04655 [Candidatus Omnitrophota bacterium]|nr:MAG: hypothetical protein JSW18_04655 [Candidatus Omnitrophota bacterium]